MQASLPVFLDHIFDEPPIGRAEVDTEADTVTIVVKASLLLERIELENRIKAGPFRHFTVSFGVQSLPKESE